jgi:hypothetical protein
MADIGLPYHITIVIGKDNEAIGHAGKVTSNVCHVVILTAVLQNDSTSLKLAPHRVGSSDNRSDHFTKHLPLVPFWTHTNAMMGARFLTRRHIGHLGFSPHSRNRHLPFLFGVDLGSSQTAHQLGGVKDNESKDSTESLELKKADEGFVLLT